jgi:uncharacterized membrane protein YhhN
MEQSWPTPGRIVTILLFALSAAAATSGVLAIRLRMHSPSREWRLDIFKPLTTVLILLPACLASATHRSAYGLAIVTGLVLSLIGDVLLAPPLDRFVAGLGSFLLAHLSYSFAFVAVTRLGSCTWPAIPLALIGAAMLWYLWPALQVRLRAPVAVYVLVIVAIASLAVQRLLTSPSPSAWTAAIGALLFLASDAALAISRFRRPIPFAEAVILGNYFAAQLLIAWSVPLSGASFP